MGRAFGQVATSATTEVAINATTYAEQTSNAGRALVSGSANDAAAGTGARTVKVTYYALSATGVITGPFSETVTLNGTNAVATVGTNICLIEKIEVLTVGSGGKSAGIISLTVAADGSGGTIASIAAGAQRTYLGHHYVPSGRRCDITDWIACGGDTAAGLFTLRALAYPSANVQETIITRQAAVIGGNANQVILGPQNGERYISGPARIQAYVAPTATAQTSYVEFGHQDL